jgi:hypothetical protein
MYMKTKDRPSAAHDKAGMLLIAKEIRLKSGNVVEKNRG